MCAAPFCLSKSSFAPSAKTCEIPSSNLNGLFSVVIALPLLSNCVVWVFKNPSKFGDIFKEDAPKLAAAEKSPLEVIFPPSNPYRTPICAAKSVFISTIRAFTYTCA